MAAVLDWNKKAAAGRLWWRGHGLYCLRLDPVWLGSLGLAAAQWWEGSEYDANLLRHAPEAVALAVNVLTSHDPCGREPGGAPLSNFSATRASAFLSSSACAGLAI